MYNVSPQALSTLGFDTGALSDLGLLIRLDRLSVSPKDHISVLPQCWGACKPMPPHSPFYTGSGDWMQVQACKASPS